MVVTALSSQDSLSPAANVQELHSQEQDDPYAQLIHMLRLPSVDILDESDEVLNHKSQLVYAWGAQCHLPSLSERVVVIQHVLEVLCKDQEIRKLLLPSAASHETGSIESETASFTFHQERFGSLPSIRLVPGAPDQSRQSTSL